MIGSGMASSLPKIVDHQLTSSVPKVSDQLLEQAKSLNIRSGTESRQVFETFNAVQKTLDEEYTHQETLDQMKASGTMRQNALRGFVSSLNDPYTVYLEKVDSDAFSEDLKGTTDFEGI